MKKVLLLAPLAAVVSLLSLTAQANIVTNGNFLGSTSCDSAPGWTFTAAASGSDFCYDTTARSGAGLLSGYAGDYANFGAVNYPLDDEISQALSTVAGDTYAISFWLSNNSGPNNFFGWFGGTEFLSLNDSPTFGWTEYTESAVATSSSTTLAFYGSNDPSWYSLAEVSVVETSAVVAVPEPGTLALFGAALFGATLWLRRRRLASRVR